MDATGGSFFPLVRADTVRHEESEQPGPLWLGLRGGERSLKPG
jgi:hypothetical protein